MSAPVRVLHVAEAFGGGLMEMVRLVAEHGARSGSVQAIAFGRRPETPDDVRAAVAAEVELFELPWGTRRPAAEARSIRALRGIAGRWQPDVVHLHSSFAGFTGRAAFGRRAPVIFTPHAFASELPGTGVAQRALFGVAERAAVRLATVVGAVSESEGVAARARGAREVVVIPNGIPELDDAPATPAPRARTGRVVAAGRLTAQRQPEAAARILARVADVASPHWVGGGGWGAAGRTGLAALESAGIPVSGWVPRSEMLAEFARADAYLHWTSWDGLPYTVMEAMAFDAVVVASDIAPNRELLDSRQVCRTEDEAVALLRRVVTDDAFAAELREAQARRRGAYSARRMAEAWLSTYERLAT